MTFAAIDKYLQRNIPTPVERHDRGHDWLTWGEGNAYPDYLLDLYREVTTLRSAIDASVDYTCGNGATTTLFGGGRMNRHNETVDDIVRALALNKFIYGGMALQVIRNGRGEVSEIYAIPVRYLRTDREGEVFWYSEDWGRGGRGHAVVYPKYVEGLNPSEEHAASILYVKGIDFQAYPAPVYAAAVKACEIERSIDDFHLNALANGFMGSYMFNFNNGVPTDEMKDEIERSFTEKFAGHENAGRVVFSWNRDKDAATTIEKIDIEDFGEKYNTLAKHSRTQIFAAFRANANLFGIPTENNGFNAEEYESAFRLFNRTMIRPVQAQIADMFDKVAGYKGALTIKPFSMDYDGEEAVQ